MLVYGLFCRRRFPRNDGRAWIGSYSKSNKSFTLTPRTSAITLSFVTVISVFPISTRPTIEREIAPQSKSSCFKPFSFLNLFRCFPNFCKYSLFISKLLAILALYSISTTDKIKDNSYEHRFGRTLQAFGGCFER